MLSLSLEKKIKSGLLGLIVVIILAQAYSFFSAQKSYVNFNGAAALSANVTTLDRSNYNLAMMRYYLNSLLVSHMSGEPWDESRAARINNGLAGIKSNVTTWLNEPRVNKIGEVMADDISTRFYALTDYIENSVNELRNGTYRWIDKTEDYDALAQSISLYIQEAKKLETWYIGEAKLDRDTLFIVSTVLCILFLGLYVLTSSWFKRNILKRINTLSALFEEISRGNLAFTMNVDAKDELGQLFSGLGSMKDELVSVISSVQETSSKISQSSAKISVGNQDLSARTEQQASALQQTAASMEEIKTTVKNNADNARLASQLALDANEVANNGAVVMNNVIATMQKIEQSATLIADINNVITGIANQTNILALNAAVEAARAGEQGRGFAVVASEVRNLAKSSADAAKEISDLICESVSNASQGTLQVQDAGKRMQDIVNSITQVSNIMSEITVASDEQSAGINQIATAVNEMDIVTQQNAALVVESATITGHMDRLAHKLSGTVAVFKTEGAEISPAY
ncbi:methyl-accepting chemotaxis protein [Cedecea colo]|uniref:HAMP domain-containing protein n=1 Tax=Cedecea colo TaxID=2552946 RepID=A0ABX0VI93_9ENTR|nr:methyl-accepting chemotaxis protein [Cedecea colo]NIY46701.1 HAMP domain-containing protein [Cedecea colo]